MVTFHFPIPGIRISDYTYDLPNRIARYPLPVRHDSKLLVAGMNKLPMNISETFLDCTASGKFTDF